MPTTPAGLDLQGLLKRGERVFPACPQVGRYFPAASIEDARTRVSRAIDRGDGPCLVVGGPGTGKSLLLQVLAAQYHERFDVVMLGCAPLRTRRALLQAILFELGLPYRVPGEGELRLSLLDHLLSANDSAGGLLLLVDEAQSLPPALLDELRVMTNLVRGGAPRVRLVLAGSAALEESFAHVELESFSQRLSSRCYLAPMTRHETSQYLRAQVAACGGEPDRLFVGESASAVFEATDGVPRLVNQLCDRALVLAQANHLAAIDRELVQSAWSDLQQLPTPWETSPALSAAAPSTQVIEFGQLSDEPFEDSGGADVAEIEPTELDAEELAAEPAPSHAAVERAPIAAAWRNDPFGEPFDEEEIVLDNFAAWDNLFLRDSLRVENRRDPGFAALVQEALDASPGAAAEVADVASEASAQPHPTLAQTEEQSVEFDEPVEAVLDFTGGNDDFGPALDGEQDLPPLRLAFVSDAAPLAPIPFLPTSPLLGHAAPAFDPVLPEEDEFSPADWTASFAGGSAENSASSDSSGTQLLDEAPILVIEEDAPEPLVRRPQARRQEYRHLFSRLRSG